MKFRRFHRAAQISVGLVLSGTLIFQSIFHRGLYIAHTGQELGTIERHTRIYSTMNLRNVFGDEVQFQIESVCGTLAIGPSFGLVEPRSSKDVRFEINTGSLATGHYRREFAIRLENHGTYEIVPGFVDFDVK